MDTLKEDMREIKADLKELIKQGARHNIMLETHEARSLALQQEQKLQAARLEPIQKHVDYINALGKTLLTILVGLTIYALQQWLF